jgi:hypothetical protein
LELLKKKSPKRDFFHQSHKEDDIDPGICAEREMKGVDPEKRPKFEQNNTDASIESSKESSARICELQIDKGILLFYELDIKPRWSNPGEEFPDRLNEYGLCSAYMVSHKKRAYHEIPYDC